jgi:hypothetical protein
MKRAKILASMLLIIALHQVVSGQRKQGTLLQKSAGAVFANSARSVQSSQITIRLTGLHPADFINFRPGTQLIASAGTLVKGEQPVPGLDAQRSFSMEALKPGETPPDAALEVAPAEVRFTRPASGDIVFLDIQVPERARVRVIADGKLVLKALVHQPLAFRNQGWGEGALGIPGTAMRAARPNLSANAAPLEPVYDRNSGTYVVPASRLTILKRKPVSGLTEQTVIVVLQIDATGRVVKIKPLTDSPPPDLEGTFKHWRFAPYLINGSAVAVTTVLSITPQ